MADTTDTTTEVRADIEQTRARMSGAIAELEKKADIAEQIREHPWAAVGLAFGAGIALSGSRADVKAAQVTSQATKDTSTKLGGALDGVVAALIAGVTEAVHSRVDGAVKEIVTSIRGQASQAGGAASSTTAVRSFSRSDRPPEQPMRAD
jgi:Protein of unknown function (DUF3618)